MNKYYVPTEEDFKEGLILELYDEEEKSWLPHTLSSNSSSAFLPLLKVGDIRVKYLNSTDFKKVGLQTEMIFLRTQDFVAAYGEDGEEILGKENIYDTDNLNIVQNKVKIGTFKPNAMFNNVIIEGKKHSVKNLTELINILK
jgi:hypothetical protein